MHYNAFFFLLYQYIQNIFFCINIYRLTVKIPQTKLVIMHLYERRDNCFLALCATIRLSTLRSWYMNDLRVVKTSF